MTSSTGVDARTVTFDNLDRPIKIVKGSATTVFRYAPDGSDISKEPLPANPYPKTVYYVDKMYEKIVWNGATEEKDLYRALTVVIPWHEPRCRLLHVDRLGSRRGGDHLDGGRVVLDRARIRRLRSPGMRTSLPHRAITLERLQRDGGALSAVSRA